MANPAMSDRGALNFLKYLGQANKNGIRDPEIWWYDRRKQLEWALKTDRSLCREYGHWTWIFKTIGSTPLHESWFGTSRSEMANFPRISSLNTNFLPPWLILIMPTLRKFHIKTTSLDHLIQYGLCRDNDPYIWTRNWWEPNQEAQDDAKYLFNMNML
ncbi:hypothetical protein PSPO01_08762 [Paraphaeosphaeria sporulosa]